MNVRRGDIRNKDYAFKAKTYAWSKLSELLPRKSSPTDIDGSIELSGSFLFAETKTIGFPLDPGQEMYYERLLGRLKSYGCVFILEHDRLEEVEALSDFRTVEVWHWDDDEVAIRKMNKVPCNDKVVKWLFSEWALYAEGMPNDFIPRMRESAGLSKFRGNKQFDLFPSAGGSRLVTPSFSFRSNRAAS